MVEPKKDEEIKEVSTDDVDQDQKISEEKMQEIQKLLAQQNITGDEGLVNMQRQFWDTQPSMKMEEEYTKKGALDQVKKVAEVKQDGYSLPPGYEWGEVDLADEDEITKVYNLLYENYVEDDDNMFRFDYSIPFLKWALMPPGYRKDWHIAVVVAKTKRLVGFISAIPAKVQVYGSKVRMVEINFLCVHKKLRTHRLAPVLIKEITRRVNLTDTWQAVYTAGSIITKPVGKARYYHRSLNPKKLIEINFSRLQPKMTMARTVKLYKLPEEPLLEGIRPMVKKDVQRVGNLLKNYLKQCDLYTHYSEEDIGHFFLPRDDVINTFVIEKNGDINDFCSFYSLPSTVIDNPKHNHMRAAYSYYNVAKTVPLVDLMKDALIFAKQLGYDVFNALDVMENSTIFSDLKFGVGDGDLQYYLYNWGCPNISAAKIGVVLV